MRVGHVALIGRPNVGKSTLLNALLGQKVAIVSDKPQTTRISILGIKTTAAGQIIFIDNPGIHKPLHTLNKRMMNFVYSALQAADLLCLLIDATQSHGRGDEFVIETLRNVTTPLFLLINKVDMVRKDKILPMIADYKDRLDFKEIIPISALRGINLEVLEKKILEYLPEAEKLYDDQTITNLPLRFRLAEVIREKLLKHVEKELPFVTAVLVEQLEERPGRPDDEREEEEEPRPAAAVSESPSPSGSAAPGAAGEEGLKKKRGRRVTYIGASVFVERDNHRKIVLGRNGRVIKEVGIDARREIEALLGSKVFLDLSVKVRPRWRDSAAVLDLIEGQR
jgi:GTP-binding protein Era